MKNGTEVVNSATAFYQAAVKHLAKPVKSENVCQHHMLTFELHKKIGTRSKRIHIGFLYQKHINYTVLETLATHLFCIYITLLVVVKAASMGEYVPMLYVQIVGKDMT